MYYREIRRVPEALKTAVEIGDFFISRISQAYSSIGGMLRLPTHLSPPPTMEDIWWSPLSSIVHDLTADGVAPTGRGLPGNRRKQQGGVLAVC